MSQPCSQEGLVLKRKDSLYCPNARDAKKWMKIKPEYLDENIGDDLDVLIVGNKPPQHTQLKII